MLVDSSALQLDRTAVVPSTIGFLVFCASASKRTRRALEILTVHPSLLRPSLGWFKIIASYVLREMQHVA